VINSTVKRKRFNALAKRIFDISFSTIGLLLLLPIFLVVALVIWLCDRKTVFFRQVRVGRGGVSFHIIKFRTMVIEAEEQGVSVTRAGDRRITPIGRVLRGTKIDELPQLWNVLKGEMSFVGPRPEVPQYVEKYTPAQLELLQFKPGITDWASMLFRNEEELLREEENPEDFYVKHCIPKKFSLNMQYAERANVFRDIWIIVLTLLPHRLSLLLVYTFFFVMATVLSIFLRFDFQVPAVEWTNFEWILLWTIGLKVGLLFYVTHFHGLLSYFSRREIFQLLAGLSFSCGIQLLYWYLSDGWMSLPRSVIVIDFLTSFFLLCMVRFSLRSLREKELVAGLPLHGGKVKRVGIIGAATFGAALAKQFMDDRTLGIRVESFFDDLPQRWHRFIHGVHVVGMPELLKNEVWRGKIDEVIVAIPEASVERQKQISAMLRTTGLKFHIVPSVSQIRNGDVIVSQLEE
jgi:lipopolysaccharide/colanic/teichoic acid biosynthesis glycosyltransferase